MEEIADAISGAFVDDHGIWPIKDTGTCGANHVFGLISFGGLPESDLR